MAKQARVEKNQMRERAAEILGLSEVHPSPAAIASSVTGAALPSRIGGRRDAAGATT